MPRGTASFRTEEKSIAAAYRRFAETEAHGRSPLHEKLASGVAADPTIIEFLLTLPQQKRQPNLLLAAARRLCGTPSGWVEFRRNVITNAGALRELMLVRSTQTNEPGRCAILLPLLARLPQPLALLEVGASAGLCLLPDRYGYDYDGHLLRPDAAWPEPPIFPCAHAGTMPLPKMLPQIAWRAGLDLNPIDVNDPEEAAWLETLVWPEQTARLARLRAAMAIAATARPWLTKGDLRHDLVALAAEMPREATRVIFHTAVLATSRRDQLAKRSRAQSAGCTMSGSRTKRHRSSPTSPRAPMRQHSPDVSLSCKTAHQSPGPILTVLRWTGSPSRRRRQPAPIRSGDFFAPISASSSSSPLTRGRPGLGHFWMVPAAEAERPLSLG